QERFRELLILAIVRHDLPFQFVEYDAIRSIFTYLKPQVNHFTRNNAMADILMMHKNVCSKLAQEMRSCPGNICFTSDLWTSIATDGYICLTTHFIDSKWVLQKKVINFYKHQNVVEEKRIKWYAMKKRIKELVRNINISNIREIADEVSKEDLFEGRGLFCKAIMKSQMKSPKLTDVYAAFVAIINSSFPDVGFLLVKRVVLKLKQGYYKYDGRSNKKKLRLLSKLLAHLVNQSVVSAILAWDVFLFLMGNPNSDNVEVAVKFCIECGSTFQELLPDKFRTILDEFDRVSQVGEIERSVRFLISMLFKIQRDRFRDYPAMTDELNVVNIVDQQIHHVSMLHVLDSESSADDFVVDPYNFRDIEDSSEDDEVSSWKP
ncbi:hypothetical protein F511_12125, partial [Dorcoceras hygrometricum]